MRTPCVVLAQSFRWLLRRAAWSSACAALLGVGCQDQPLGLTSTESLHTSFDTLVRAHLDKVDILFVIDNSSSMADKHPWLGPAVADVIERMVNPPCISSVDGATVLSRPDDPRVPCESGEREIAPLRDLHLGFITTSLGGHGHPSHCEDPSRPAANDRAHLLPTVRALDLPTYRDQGFFAFDARLEVLAEPEAIRDPRILRESIETVVEAAGTDGCEFEAPLEAWYRFLVDPSPADHVVERGGRSVKVGVDPVVLKQRADFLRHDSLVLIVMISDENDCSVQDSGESYKLGDSCQEPATSACADAPNDPCCFSCGLDESSVPAGCRSPSEDPACEADPICAAKIACFDQKRRFGVDHLYPTSRYKTALDSIELCPDSTYPDADCQCRRALELGVDCQPGAPVRNPLYTNLRSTDGGMLTPALREPGLVWLAGIVGVPWQDLATEATLDPGSPALAYEDSHVIDWDLISGRPDTATTPRARPADPLMVERSDPRMDLGAHPIVGLAPASPDAGIGAHPINSHEWSPQDGEGLQYACVFDLESLIGADGLDCSAGDDPACECFDATSDLSEVTARRKPLCQGPDGYGTTQVLGKAYPGLRQLEVLRGANSLVGSICPKIADPFNPDSLYLPVFDGLFPRPSFLSQHAVCSPPQFPIDPSTGHVPCRVIEALTPEWCLADCGLMPGRHRLDSPEHERTVRQWLAEANQCDSAKGPACTDMCLCEVQQLEGLSDGEPLWQCRNLVEGVRLDVFGFCYVDPSQDAGHESLVSDCASSEKRGLRFLGDETPRNFARVFIACGW